ncbi:DedA family protein [Leucobacter sp. BZR 635]
MTEQIGFGGNCLSAWEWVTNAIETFALATVESPWVLLIVLALCIIDAIFPPVPSESVIIAIATVVVADHPNTLWLLGAIAAVGAFAGDQMVYWIGRRLGQRNPAWLRGTRAQRTLGWARRAIRRSGPILIMTGRFIPVGRTAVNLAAGTTRYPAWKFSIAAGFAAVFWAAYSIAIGAIFGNIFGSHPILALLLGLVTAFAIGLLVEFLSKRIGRRVQTRRMAAFREQLAERQAPQ